MTCSCFAPYFVLPPILEPAWTLQVPSLISDGPLEACEGRLTTTVSSIFNTFVEILFSIVSSNFLSCGFEIFILPFTGVLGGRRDECLSASYVCRWIHFHAIYGCLLNKD